MMEDSDRRSVVGKDAEPGKRSDNVLNA